MDNDTNKQNIDRNSNSSALDLFVSRPYRAGKGYAQYNEFVSKIKKGEKAMVLGPEYVVLSMNLYKYLLRKAKKQADG